MEEEPPTPPTPAPPSSPFWLHSSTARHHHRLNRPSALLLNTGFQVAVLSTLAIVLLAAATPSLISLTHHVFRPSSVKRGWDSVNLVLVLFAVVCGFLGRKDGEDQESNGDTEGPIVRTPQSVRSAEQYNWFHGGMHYDQFGNQGNVVQLRRNYSSYPDLRQEMLWEVESDRRLRSYDDSYVGNSKSPRLIRSVESFRSPQIDGDKVEKDDSDIKNIEVDAASTLKLEESIPPPAPPPSPPPPPAPPVAPDSSIRARTALRNEYESIDRRVRRDGQIRRELEPRKAPSPPPPPPPAPPAAAEQRSEGSSGGSRKNGGGVTKEIISSIYHQSKMKKKQKRKSHENLEDLVHPPNPTLLFPPPPPPPPPPASIFHNIFSSKKGKSGKKASTAPPPPPPPPPPRSIASHSITRRTNPKTKFTPKPSTKPTNFGLIDQIAGTGSESPLFPIPPPPPPPPFKMPSWKFVVEGDYVKIISSPQRGGGYSEMEDSDTSTPTAAGNTPSPLFCPSPDVNIKADDFIARFRAKLQLEKMNSIKQKQGMGIGFSPLGPDSNPSPS